MLLLGNNLYVVHKNGTIAEIQPHTEELFNVYQIPNVDLIFQYGSLSSDPPNIPNPDILLLPDYLKGEIFSYNLTSRVKQVHVTGLLYPTCVSYIFSGGSTHYIVTDRNRHMINIYNSSWGLESAFGGYGSEDGMLDKPWAAIMSSNNSILVSEQRNNRVSVFTRKGEFLHHLPIEMSSPSTLSYYAPYLWIGHYTDFKAGLYRYSLEHFPF